MKAQHMPKDSDPKDLRICPDCGKVLKVRATEMKFHDKFLTNSELLGQQSLKLPHQDEAFKINEIFLRLVRLQVLRKIRNSFARRNSSLAA